MSSYLITGLPRSRTSWLAAVASMMPGSICIHEPIEVAPCWEDACRLWQRMRVYQHVGLSDSALGFHLGEILTLWAPRTLVVMRGRKAVLDALKKQGLEQPHYCDVLHDRIAMHLPNPLVRTVEYEHLADTETVAMALAWLMPGNVIDSAKIELAQRMIVTRDMDKVRESALARAADIDKTLGADVMQEIRSRMNA